MLFRSVDGPEFDAHRVNFDILVRRNTTYRQQEQQALKEFKCAHESEADAVPAAKNGVCTVEGVKR